MSAPLLVLAGFALVTALLAWSRWLAGRRWAAAGNLLLAIAATGLLGTAWPVVRNLDTYQPMRPNQAVAEMFFEQAGARRYRATLTRLPSGRMQVFELEGDEWRLAARGLDWTPRAAALGLQPVYQLEFLEARSAADRGRAGRTIDAGSPCTRRKAPICGHESAPDRAGRRRPGR